MSGATGRESRVVKGESTVIRRGSPPGSSQLEGVFRSPMCKSWGQGSLEERSLRGQRGDIGHHGGDIEVEWGHKARVEGN